MNVRHLFRRSVIQRVAIPMLLGTLFAAVLLLRVVPDRQQNAIEDSIASELESLAAAYATSAQLAFAQEDLQALSDLNRLVANDERGLQVAVFIHSGAAEELLAGFPTEANVRQSLSLQQERFFTASSPFFTEFDQGRVVVLYEKARLSEQMALLNLPLYFALAALVIIQVLIYVRLRSDVVKPVIESARLADQLGAGNYSLRPQKSDRIDEVGLLLRALRTLRTRLKLQRSQYNRLMTSLEAEVDKRTLDLQRALEAKDTFMAGVSHELRTPLHSVIASLDLMASHPELPADQQRNVNLARRGSRALMQLINELLDFQRLSQREVELQPTPQCVARVVEDVTEITEALFQDSQLSFECDIRVPSNLWAVFDSHRFTQILLNLLGNARKFTHKGKVTLRVRANLRDENEVDIYCSVLDTGPGIEPQALERLGEAFFQGEGGLARKHAGTGLGISICKRILTAMNSQLHIRSELGAGSEFSFNFSARVVPEVGHALNSGTSTEIIASELVGDVKPLSMLYVEDSEMNQLVMRALCERFPVTLEIADSAEDGYRHLKTKKYDIIVSDIQMPEHSGLDLLAWYHNDPGENADTPVFACTANATDEACEQFELAGFAGILTKPVSLSELHSFLANL